MWERLRRFSTLPRPAKSVFLRALILFPLLTLSLRLRGFRATQRVLRKFVAVTRREKTNDANGERETATVALVSRMVVAASRYSPIPSTCLEQSLALWWLLARQGIAAQFRIGVRKDGEKFAAHAWVEHAGLAIGQSDSAHLHYAAFAQEMSGESS